MMEAVLTGIVLQAILSAVRAACGVALFRTETTIERRNEFQTKSVISNFKLAPDKNPMQSSFDSLSNPGPPFDY
jgi:hypothetical protein